MQNREINAYGFISFVPLPWYYNSTYGRTTYLSWCLPIGYGATGRVIPSRFLQRHQEWGIASILSLVGKSTLMWCCRQRHQRWWNIINTTYDIIHIRLFYWVFSAFCSQTFALTVFLKVAITDGVVFKVDGIERIFQRSECLQSDGRLELTLPNDDCVPSHLGQLHQSLLIPCFVPFYFVFPKLGIGFRHFKSLAVVMPVPETTVDEDAGSVFSHD